jgi:hypothetical protein
MIQFVRDTLNIRFQYQRNYCSCKSYGKWYSHRLSRSAFVDPSISLVILRPSHPISARRRALIDSSLTKAEELHEREIERIVQRAANENVKVRVSGRDSCLSRGWVLGDQSRRLG